MRTHRELKEALYYDIIDLFKRGKMWEEGIKLCKELATQHERETFRYQQLAEILVITLFELCFIYFFKHEIQICVTLLILMQKMQAELYEHITSSAVRANPEYFFVGYYGLGFPSFLRVSFHSL